MNSDARVGVIVPSSNTVAEMDFHTRLMPGVRIQTARVFLAATTRAAEMEMLETHLPAAVRDTASARPDVVAFACTSGAAILGADGEDRMMARLAEETKAEAVSTSHAVATVLGRCNGARIGVITAYTDDLNEAIASSLIARGVNVASISGMGIQDNFAIASVTPDEIVDFAGRGFNPRETDVIFVSCTNLRAVEARARMENEFGVPVVTSNSATIDLVRERLVALGLVESRASPPSLGPSQCSPDDTSTDHLDQENVS